MEEVREVKYLGFAVSEGGKIDVKVSYGLSESVKMMKVFPLISKFYIVALSVLYRRVMGT